MRAAALAFTAFALTASVAWGVSSAQSSQPSSKPPPPAGATPPAAESYTYQPEGRRDPFVSLLGTGAEPRLASKRSEGPPGLAVADISVRGVIQSRGAYVALVQGPDNRTFTVRVGDKFLDGTVRTVSEQGLVIVQPVNDPLSLVKQREIRKLLRSFEPPREQP